MSIFLTSPPSLQLHARQSHFPELHLCKQGTGIIRKLIHWAEGPETFWPSDALLRKHKRIQHWSASSECIGPLNNLLLFCCSHCLDTFHTLRRAWQWSQTCRRATSFRATTSLRSSGLTCMEHVIGCLIRSITGWIVPFKRQESRPRFKAACFCCWQALAW